MRCQWDERANSEMSECEHEWFARPYKFLNRVEVHVRHGPRRQIFSTRARAPKVNELLHTEHQLVERRLTRRRRVVAKHALRFGDEGSRPSSRS